MDENEKMDLQIPDDKEAELIRMKEELQKTKDQLYLANNTIKQTKDLLLNIAKAALQMV